MGIGLLQTITAQTGDLPALARWSGASRLRIAVEPDHPVIPRGRAHARSL
jgi:hypothetical protein